MLTVEALVPAVGITGLNPSSGWPQAEGLRSKILGTNTKYDTSIDVSPGAVAANEGRLGNILAALINTNQVRVTDAANNVLSASDVLAATSMGVVPQVGQVPVPPTAGNVVAVSGTWTAAFNNVVTNGFDVTRTAAAAVEKAVLLIPGADLFDASGSGKKPIGFNLVYQVDTADVNDVDIEVFRVSQPANGTAPSAVSLKAGQTYDAAHDTAAERGDSTGAPEQHTMEVMFDDALAAVDFLNSGDSMHAVITVDGTVAGAVTLLGWSLVTESRLQ